MLSLDGAPFLFVKERKEKEMEKTAKIGIKGIKPLLFNRFPEGEVDSKADDQRDPKERLYLVDGKIYTPSTHIYGALIDAAENFEADKKKSNYGNLFASSLSVEPEEIIHKIQKWEIFSISVPNKKGRYMLRRPMLSEWELEFNIVFDESDIPAEVLRNALDWAGRFSGIGDWRPNKGGRYGKFMVTKFEVI